MVVGSLHVIRLHHTAVIVAEVAIVDCGMVCIHRALQGQLLLVGRVLGVVGPCVLHRFIQEGVDRARYIAVAPGLCIAWLFRLIVATVVLPVASAGALDARALCCSMLGVVGAIVIVITLSLNITALLVVIVVRVASYIT